MKIENRWFIDGGVGSNNPSYEIYYHYAPIGGNTPFEPSHAGLPFTRTRCINIGTGTQPQNATVLRRSKFVSLLPESVRDAVEDLYIIKDVVVEAEKTAEFMRTLFGTTEARENHEFVRFSANTGVAQVKMYKYRKLDYIRIKTEDYIKEEATAEALIKTAKLIAEDYIQENLTNAPIPPAVPANQTTEADDSVPGPGPHRAPEIGPDSLAALPTGENPEIQLVESAELVAANADISNPHEYVSEADVLINDPSPSQTTPMKTRGQLQLPRVSHDGSTTSTGTGASSEKDVATEETDIHQHEEILEATTLNAPLVPENALTVATTLSTNLTSSEEAISTAATSIPEENTCLRPSTDGTRTALSNPQLQEKIEATTSALETDLEKKNDVENLTRSCGQEAPQLTSGEGISGPSATRA
jgi:hypothetical protein